MRESMPEEKECKRKIIEQQIRSYLRKGGKIEKLNPQEFSTNKPKQLDWSGRELRNRERDKHEPNKKV